MTFVILAAAVALVVAAVMFYRMDDRQTAAIGFGLVALALVLFVLIPAIAGITINWTGLPLLLGVLTLALLLAGTGTGRPFFGMLGVITAAWLACLVFGLSWWVLALAILAAALMAADMITRRSIFAVLALVSLVSSVLVGVNTSDGAQIKAEVLRQLDLANVQLEAEAVSAKDAEQDRRMSYIENRLDKVEADVAELKHSAANLTDRVVSLEKGSVTVTGSPADMDTETAATAVADMLVGQGITKFSVGTIDKSKNPYDVGRNPFIADPVYSKQELARITSHPANAKERAIRDHLVEAAEKLTPEERARALKGEGYIPVQFDEAVCYSGNTFFEAETGTAERDGVHCREAGDVWWVYVSKDGVVHQDLSVRADCGNPGATNMPAPAPKRPRSEQAKAAVCPPKSDHPGRPLGEGPCDDKEKPKPTTTPSVPTTTPTPNPTPSTTPTPTPTPTTTPTPTPTPTPEPKKTEADPNANGNQGNGGGANEDSGSGPVTTPTQPPTTPRVNPTASQPSAQPGVPAQPSAEATVPAENDPADACSPAPGEKDC